MERAKLLTADDGVETAVNSNEKRLISPSRESILPLSSPGSDRPISQNQLINKLNYLNFCEKPLYVNFRHEQFQRTLSIKARPQPCQDKHLTCLWQQDAASIVHQPNFYRFQNIVIPDGKRFLLAEPEVLEINQEAIRLILTDVCRAADARSTERHSAHGISVYVTQNGVLFCGSMTNFSASSFLVQVHTTPPQTFDWLDVDQPIHVILFDGGRALFSGDCQILKQTAGHLSRDYILKPLNRRIQRFRPKTFRSTRQKMTPLPTISFMHPLSKKHVNLEVADLSGSGLAVMEDTRHAVLLPGLILPHLLICFGDGAQVNCAAQVVYSHDNEETGQEGTLRCGIAFLDMPADEHVKVLALLQQTNDKHAYLCNRVNLDELWNFFFETGFIYPQKYEFIAKNKDRIKKTYKKLYTENPNIARHFIHQRNGRIMAHMAMVRFYNKAWLIHHHAAIRASGNRGGLAVLNQIGSFINNSHRLDAIKMHYVFCYYRPDNKFPAHVFGGAAKNIMNPKGCSVDPLAYFHIRKEEKIDAPSEGWTLEATTDSDLGGLDSCYEENSGGLMIQALDLESDHCDITETTAAFEQIGLRRSRHLYSLNIDGGLKGIIIINMADIGLNMSDLTNSVLLVIVDEAGLTYPIVKAALLELFGQLQIAEMPVLMYPVQSATAMAAPIEKIYNLWVLNMNHTDDYFRYLQRLLKFIKH